MDSYNAYLIKLKTIKVVRLDINSLRVTLLLLKFMYQDYLVLLF